MLDIEHYTGHCKVANLEFNWNLNPKPCMSQSYVIVCTIMAAGSP
jgi:hypothetical protein